VDLAPAADQLQPRADRRDVGRRDAAILCQTGEQRRVDRVRLVEHRLEQHAVAGAMPP
jgi:hypothetical protein